MPTRSWSSGVRTPRGALKTPGGSKPTTMAVRVYGDVVNNAGGWMGASSVQGVPTNPGCATLDLDCDGDVDLLDWGIFQVEFTGSIP